MVSSKFAVVFAIIAVFSWCEIPCLVYAKPLSRSFLSADSQWSTKTNRLRNFGTADAVKYLRSYGYLPSANDKNSWDLVSDLQKYDLERALQTYQGYSGLPVTGKLDQETLRNMKKPRCGVQDIETKEEAFQERLAKLLGLKLRKKRFIIQGSMFDHPIVTWGIKNLSTRMTKEYAERIVKRAVRTWEKQIPRTFVQMHYSTTTGRWSCSDPDDFECNGGRPTPDIEMKFAVREHGDSKPFDGSGEALAHAFYPDDTTEPGNIHFDDDEPWGPSGRNFLWVSSHEIGHSLGLEHSTNPQSLMHASYSGHGVGEIKLHQDDLEGIQKLYGKRYTPLPPIEEPAPPANTNPQFSSQSNLPQQPSYPLEYAAKVEPTTTLPVPKTQLPTLRPTPVTPWRVPQFADSPSISTTPSPAADLPWRLPQYGNWNGGSHSTAKPYKSAAHQISTTTTAQPKTTRSQYRYSPKPAVTRQPWWKMESGVQQTQSTTATVATRPSTAAPMAPVRPPPNYQAYQPVQGAPDICKDSSLDSMAVVADGKVLAFKGGYYWTWNPKLEKYFDRTPKRITENWKGLQPNLDAVFTDDFQYTWAFKNNQLWQYDARADGTFTKISGPTLIWNSKDGFYGLKSRLDAALSLHSGGSNSPVYFFSGRRYWRDANYDGETDDYTLHTNEIGPNIDRIDAAVYLGGSSDASAYIFSGQFYYKVKEFRNRLKAQPSYPKRIGPDWFGCS